MISIIKIRHIKEYILEITFDDNCVKRFDFEKLIVFNGIAEPLKNINYFKNVNILNDGRSFGWDNNYDCCADWARYYAKDLSEEWKDIDEKFNLKQRILIAKQNLENKFEVV
jgi:hypothetical protein